MSEFYNEDCLCNYELKQQKLKKIYQKVAFFLFSSQSEFKMDRTDEEILKNDPELANLFTDDEEEEDESQNFNFGRSRNSNSSRRSQSAKLG